MIAIAGAGAFGTALAIALGREGRAVALWGRDVAGLADTRQNARHLPGIEVMTPDDPRLYCGITSMRFTRHADQQAMVERLLNEYNLFTVVRNGAASGPSIRITPGLTTTADDMQLLTRALNELR